MPTAETVKEAETKLEVESGAGVELAAEAEANDPPAEVAPLAETAKEAESALQVADAAQAQPSAAQAVPSDGDTKTAPPPSTSDIVADLASQPDVEVEIDDDGTTRVVRILSVGQEISGVVKRITEFGAFIDIGVGRDGLVHISELSVRRVGKVTDVLSEGQEVTAWIKKLDRERNRISLTLIDPTTKTIRDLEKGEIVEGTVSRITPYGAFVDIGVGRDALLHVREMGEGYVAKPEDVVHVGDQIEARVIELSRRRSRVDLSLKGLRPEPEPEPIPEPVQAEPAPVEESEPESYAEVEVLSPMELAFKRAMEAEGIELKVSKKKQGKRKGRERGRSIQDEIIARTLNSGRSK